MAGLMGASGDAVLKLAERPQTRGNCEGVQFGVRFSIPSAEWCESQIAFQSKKISGREE